jgi:hypothetical protein
VAVGVCGTCTHEELDDYFAKVIPSPNLVVPIWRRGTMKESEKTKEKRDAGQRVQLGFVVCLGYFFIIIIII